MNTWIKHKSWQVIVLLGALMVSTSSFAWQNQAYNRGNFGYYNNNNQHNPYYRGNIYRGPNYYDQKKYHQKQYNNQWRYKQGNYYNNYWYNPGIIRTCKIYQVCTNYGGCTLQQYCY